MLGQFCCTDDMAMICVGSWLSTFQAHAGRGAARGARAWVRRRTGAIPPSRSTCQCGCCETVIRRGGAAMAHRGAGRRRYGSEIDRWPVAGHCVGRPAPVSHRGWIDLARRCQEPAVPGHRPATSLGDGGRFRWRGDALDLDALGQQCIDHGRQLARAGFPEGRTARLNVSSITG
jgi:hypothetical protein